jgi:hypothetical protein
MFARLSKGLRGEGQAGVRFGRAQARLAPRVHPPVSLFGHTRYVKSATRLLLAVPVESRSAKLPETHSFY